jgi:predicted DNA-binding protein
MARAKVQNPTTIRLSPAIKRRLEAVASAQNRSQSFVVEQALEAHLGSVDQRAPDAAERLASWRVFLDSIRYNGPRRSAEEIDADIREQREDRPLPFRT